MKKRLLLLFAALGCFSTSAQIGRHTVVADLPGMFCGWCANEGGWSWDNELLVGFVAKAFEDRGDTVDGHNAVKEASEFHYLARSTDRGRPQCSQRGSRVPLSGSLDRPRTALADRSRPRV